MNKTVRLTMAQALVKFLTKQYISVDGEKQRFVHGVMGIFGHGNVVGIGQALEQYKDEIPYIAGKNEQEIAHVCTAFAKQNRRRAIYACTASIGPGSLNLVTAAGTATVNRIPLLLFPGDIYADRQPDPVLQQMENEADYTVSVNDAFKPVCRYWDRILRPEQLMTAMLNGMRTLTDPERTGAVAICLPQDVQGEAYDYPEEFFAERIWYLDRTPASEDAVERAATVIKAAKRPILLSGGGVRYSDAGKALLELSTRCGIPVCETQAGKGEIDCNYDMYLGCAGICGTLAANVLAREADVVIAVGTKLNDFVTNSKFGFQPEAKVVGINVSRMDALKLDAESVVCDARAGLEALTAALSEYKSQWGERVAVARRVWDEERERLCKIELEEGFSQTRALMELNQILTEEENIVAASGSLPSDLERVWNVKRSGQYHLEYGFSCMAYEISGALGVKFAEPQREVYSFIGDGGFLMGHSDLVTSLQERRKINVLLFNNNGHQCIHNLQRNQGCDTFGTEFRYREKATGELTGSYLPIDFCKVAEGYGAKTYRVHNPEELKAAIEDARKQETSTLIEIMVLPGTMTDGYENFWRVGTAEVSEKKSIQKAYDKLHAVVKTLRKY